MKPRLDILTGRRKLLPFCRGQLAFHCWLWKYTENLQGLRMVKNYPANGFVFNICVQYIKQSIQLNVKTQFTHKGLGYTYYN